MIFYFIKLLVSCPPLDDLSNGTFSCSLGDDGVPSYEDTCTFTCNTGYELTGSDTRTCQSNGSWSGSSTMCRRSESFYTYVVTLFMATRHHLVLTDTTRHCHLLHIIDLSITCTLQICSYN